ncbi:MAG: peptidoglycan DD-metalloendopeptidase family protein [Gammaproteobacteria bacterium]|nr:peptidoglycan DD-metalloendopeptidase family protein [Gammaproteobacteria bacterium]
MSRDYKPTMGSGARVQKKEGLPAHWIGLAASVALITSIFFLVPDNAKATRADFLENNTQITNAQTSSAQVTSSQITMPLAIPGNTAPGTEAKNNPRSTNASTSNSTSTQKNTVWKTATVKNGDNMALIFSRAGLSPQELYRVMSADKEASVLKHLMPGQKLKFQIDDGALQQLVYKIDALNTLHVKQNPDESFAVSTDTRKMETRVTNASGVINSSLFLAGQKADLSDNLIMELAGIFGWDVDFALDIRGGDHFTLVYEELFLDGKKQRDGNIIAAEFNNRGKTYRALRYTDAKGISDYFSPDGKSMRKAFIRTPVDFTRISSRFGKRRHPTLNKMKNHHGVDYAAPRGTPIKAAGDGKLTYVGRKGGYGKTVMIQHGGKYGTLYAHMSRIKPGMRRGKKVRQGQTIGYVGSTGRSTGPHLHYEFRVNGVHRNPLRVRLPDAAPIHKNYKTDFLNKSRGLVALLDVLKRTNTTLALNDSTN